MLRNTKISLKRFSVLRLTAILSSRVKLTEKSKAAILDVCWEEIGTRLDDFFLPNLPRLKTLKMAAKFREVCKFAAH